MTSRYAVAAALLLLAAVALAWPAHSARARRRSALRGPGVEHRWSGIALLAPDVAQTADPARAPDGARTPDAARTPGGAPAPDAAGTPGGALASGGAVAPGGPGALSALIPARAPGALTAVRVFHAITVAGGGRPRAVIGGAAAGAGALGWLAGGPVAGAIVGGYAALAVRAWSRRLADRAAETARARTLDELCSLAADLRAGLPPPQEWFVGADAPQTRERVVAAFRLAERTGAPIADLVERIEADARAIDRARVSAAAQAAGARATAWLLAALPVGGMAVGYGIGVDPLPVLLHTPLGAACAGGALVLQMAGLAWADRLTRSGSGGLG